MTGQMQCCVCEEFTSRKTDVSGYSVPLCKECEGESVEFVRENAIEHIEKVDRSRQCNHCNDQVHEDEATFWDEQPFHGDCLVERFKEDNPEAVEEVVEDFRELVKSGCNFEKDGNAIKPIWG